MKHHNPDATKREQRVLKDQLTKIKKEEDAFNKPVKSREKVRKDFGTLKRRVAAKERDIKPMEERFIKSQPLDELKEQETELQHQKEEDWVLNQDLNTLPSERETAQVWIEERNEELAQLQPQIEARERAWHLSERIKEIFKKYDVTMMSVLLAAGITIGAVVSTVTKVLADSSRALGKGLKETGAKVV